MYRECIIQEAKYAQTIYKIVALYVAPCTMSLQQWLTHIDQRLTLTLGSDTNSNNVDLHTKYLLFVQQYDKEGCGQYNYFRPIAIDRANPNQTR